MNFGQIKGQQQAIDFLKASLKNNRLAHCYLFIGPDGIGKKTTAFALAQYLNCKNPLGSIDSCDTCASCFKISQREHVDVSVIEPDGTSIKLKQVEDVSRNAFLRSYEGGFKVIIFDQAHLLTNEAANALLKTLEEPAEKTVFILITENPSLLPQTILSRAQSIHFRPLSASIIADLLTAQGYTDCAKIAPFANGSLTKAIALLNDAQVFAFRKYCGDFLADLCNTDAADIILWCASFDKDRQKALSFIAFAQAWYHDLLLYALNQENMIVNTDFADRFRVYSLESLSYIIKLLHTAEEHLNQNVSPRLVLEVLLLHIQEMFL